MIGVGGGSFPWCLHEFPVFLVFCIYRLILGQRGGQIFYHLWGSGDSPFFWFGQVTFFGGHLRFHGVEDGSKCRDTLYVAFAKFWFQETKGRECKHQRSDTVLPDTQSAVVLSVVLKNSQTGLAPCGRNCFFFKCDSKSMTW